MAKAAALPAFDWQNPEPSYELIWQQRAERLKQIRSMSDKPIGNGMGGLARVRVE